MSVIEGCESKQRTPVLEERICPQCGKEVELFTKNGRVYEDTACECGYVFKAEELSIVVEHKDKEE